MSAMNNQVAALLLALLLAGCRGDDALSLSEPAPGAMPRMAAMDYATDDAGAHNAAPGDVLAFSAQRMIIRNATLRGEVQVVDDWLAALNDDLRRHDGFVIDSEARNDARGVRSGTVRVRVPAARFDSLLSDLRALFSRLESEAVTGQDVTEEFVDLTARLANQREAEGRLREILQRAGSVSDVLEVERELTRVRETIERLEGRERYLRDRVALATITVEWHEPWPMGGEAAGPGFWALLGDGVRDGLRGFAEVSRGLVVVAISGLPLYILLAVMLWLLWRMRRRLRRAA